MSISAIGANYQIQTKVSAAAVDTDQKKPSGNAEVSKLNAEIKQAESEMKETMKEVQETAGKDSGSSEKVQLLQNKIQMQLQAILMKQLKVKEIESPTKHTEKRSLPDASVRSRVDRCVFGEDISNKPDNVYRLEKKNGTQTILFNRSEA